MSAVLLPFEVDGAVAWDAFAAGVDRTVAAGLVPAVNMDTGYGPSLDAAQRARVLALTAEVVAEREAVAGWRFVAGAHAADPDGVDVDLAGYRAAVDDVVAAGGVPIVFPSAGLAGIPEARLAPCHAEIAGEAPAILAFELGRQFHPHGRIWSLEGYRAVLDVPAVVGAKHSSLRRGPEWERLALRDERRPGFLVLTGNDLAIDMVRWGSDYLLGLSAVAPDAFARRDALWAAGDPLALELDDALQALGAVAFRDPVPAYRHDVALVWERRG
jgi:dihydrodipicolinate synthase/N-acetylneuraminate lyase